MCDNFSCVTSEKGIKDTKKEKKKERKKGRKEKRKKTNREGNKQASKKEMQDVRMKGGKKEVRVKRESENWQRKHS